MNTHRYRSRDYGSDPALLAASRLVENLANLMPAIRKHAWAEIALIDGNPSRTPGAVEPAVAVRGKPIGGKCSAAVPLPCAELCDLVDDAGAPLLDDDGDQMIEACGHQRPCPWHDAPGDLEVIEVVDCGRDRPCPEHDVPVELTPVERAVEQRLQVERWLADVEQQCVAIATMAKTTLDAGRRLIGTRLEVESRPSQCRDGQIGKDGTVAWGDVHCLAPAEKSGLCSKHYMAWYRWRRSNRLDTDGMFADAGARPDPGGV